MADAGDYVARVQSVQFVSSSNQHFGFAQGKFYPIMSNPGKGAKSIEVPGIVIRKGMAAGQFAVLSTNVLLKVGDVVTTGPNTIATLEFFIGGRVGLNRSASVEIVNERSVIDKKPSAKRTRQKMAGLIKADAGTLKQPIEIQTNGGVMGTRG